MKDLVSLDLLNKCFTYNEITGEFIKVMKFNWKGDLIKCKPKVVQTLNSYGYYQVNFKNKVYLVHRLICYIMNGEYPDRDVDVDHINGVRTDNRWVNIRLVDRGENLKNVGMRSDNTTGIKGVHYEKSSGKYFTFIYHNSKRVVLGRFNTIDEANEVRNKALSEYCYHDNHGKRDGWRKPEDLT